MEILSNFYVECTIKTLAAIIMSGIIGMERQILRRPAGFRTHILVCLGAMTVVIFSEQMFVKYYEQYGMGFDPTRMGAQVVSGVGFLGAGAIIHYGKNVRGLTTAASLWTVAAIGLTIGAGMYGLAAIITGSIYITLFLFKRFSNRVEDSFHIKEMIIRINNDPVDIGKLQMAVAHSDAKILEYEFLDLSDLEPHEECKTIDIRFKVQLSPRESYDHFIARLKAVENIFSIEKM